MEIEATQAAVVLRIFTSYADGQSLTQIVKTLNEESVPGSIRAVKGWSLATVSRIPDHEKYSGRWCSNKTETRRDPRGNDAKRVVLRGRSTPTPASQLWETVRQRRTEMHRTWPGGKRGFSKEQGSRQKHFPTHLRHDRPTQRQERRLLRLSRRHKGCLREQDARPSHPRREGDSRCRRRADLGAQGGRAHDRATSPCQLRRLHWRRSRQPGERRRSPKPNVASTRWARKSTDCAGLARRSFDHRPSSGSRSAWVSSKRSSSSTPPLRSAQALRNVLGPIRLELVTPDIGRPFYRALTSIDALALTRSAPRRCGGRFDFFQRWRRRELNPRPRSRGDWRLRA